MVQMVQPYRKARSMTACIGGQGVWPRGAGQKLLRHFACSHVVPMGRCEGPAFAIALSYGPQRLRASGGTAPSRDFARDGFPGPYWPAIPCARWGLEPTSMARSRWMGDCEPGFWSVAQGGRCADRDIKVRDCGPPFARHFFGHGVVLR